MSEKDINILLAGSIDLLVDTVGMLAKTVDSLEKRLTKVEKFLDIDALYIKYMEGN